MLCGTAMAVGPGRATATMLTDPADVLVLGAAPIANTILRPIASKDGLKVFMGAGFTFSGNVRILPFLEARTPTKVDAGAYLFDPSFKTDRLFMMGGTVQYPLSPKTHWSFDFSSGKRQLLSDESHMRMTMSGDDAFDGNLVWHLETKVSYVASKNLEAFAHIDAGRMNALPINSAFEYPGQFHDGPDMSINLGMTYHFR